MCCKPVISIFIKGCNVCIDNKYCEVVIIKGDGKEQEFIYQSFWGDDNSDLIEKYKTVIILNLSFKFESFKARLPKYMALYFNKDNLILSLLFISVHITFPDKFNLAYSMANK